MTIYHAPVPETTRALRGGTRDLTQYVETIRERFDSVEADVHAFIDETDRWSRVDHAVTHLKRRYPAAGERPPLYGVPIGVKDIFHVDGLPTRANSELPPSELTGAQAPVVSALLDAGAFVLGKTVTTEFAYFAPGPTRNPHALDHTPGGSSSGSAAAVATGLCPLALGSQTVGSVIRPAAFCGVVGFKPSYDRIARDGVLPLAASVDHVGLFTQNVPGMRLGAAVACPDWTTEPDLDRDPVLGVPTGPYLEQASDSGREHYRRHLDALRESGYEIRKAPLLENIDEINERHNDLVAAEAALGHADWYAEYGDRYAPETVNLIEKGREVAVSRLADARRGRTTLRESLADAMAEHGVDLWVAPAAPGPAPEGIEDTGDPVMNLPWTHAGVPAVTVPGSETADGRPLGLQIVADFGSDEALLYWAEGLATALSN